MTMWTIECELEGEILSDDVEADNLSSATEIAATLPGLTISVRRIETPTREVVRDKFIALGFSDTEARIAAGMPLEA